jgi:phosphate transport system permease protein
VTTLAPPPPAPTVPPAAPPTPRRIGSPIRPRDFGWADAGILGASLFSSYAFVWVLFYQFTVLSGVFGFFLCWYACFLALYWAVTAQIVDRQAATDRMVSALVVSGAGVVLGIVAFIVGWVAWKGATHLRVNFFTKDMSKFLPADPHVLQHIGVAHAIVGTIEQVGIAAAIAIPVAITTAVFLIEVGGRGTRIVRTVVTSMSGLPSIVAGVFIYSILVETSVAKYSGILASLALFVLMLPSVTRTTEEVLRIVPGGLREASLALGASEFRTVWSVVLPTAMSGMITASLLGIAIAVGETAPLLFTAFGNNDMNANPVHGAQQALPLLLLHLVTTPEASLVNLAYATAFILLALVLILFVLARLLGRPRTKSGVWRARLRSLRQRSPRPDGKRTGSEPPVYQGPFIATQPRPRP